MSKYKCLACGVEFEAPVKVANVRHNKYGGCKWGIGKKMSRPTKRVPDALRCSCGRTIEPHYPNCLSCGAANPARR